MPRSKTRQPTEPTTAVVLVDPQERQALTSGVQVYVDRAVALSLRGINTEADAQDAGMLLRVARTRGRAIAEKYKLIRSTIRRSLDDIKRMEREDAAPCARIDMMLAKPLERWIVEQRQIAEAANRRALEEAEAQARADQARQAEVLRAAASVALRQRDRKALETQARQVERAAPMPVVTQTVEAPVIAGISVPTRRVADVVDLKALVRAVLAGKVPEAAIKPDQSWLDDQATARGRDLNFPGVVVREVTTLAARGV